MRRIGRPIPPVMVTAEERVMLESWARRPKTAQATALRALPDPGMRGREDEHRSGERAARDQVDGGEVAEALRRAAARRVAR